MKKFLLFASAVALLASCSKDVTEDFAAPSLSGKSTVVANYVDNEPATRTYTNGVSYFWSKGDALGLFDAEAESDKTNAQYAWVEASKFEGDLKMLAGDTYYGYYPWSRGTEVKDDVIELYINAEQNYNHNEAVKVNGSFAATEAPAVAYGAAEEGVAKLDFYPVVSYMRVAVEGQGTVAQMRVMMEKDGKPVPLYGELAVTLSGLKDGSAIVGDYKVFDNEQIEFTCPDADDSTNANVQELTLNCGKGVEITSTPTYFWFVIPAAQDFAETTLTITIVGAENGEEQEFTREYGVDATKIITGQCLTVKDNTKGETTVPFKWIEGTKGKYVITNQSEFLQYAYAATNGITSEEDANEDNAQTPAYLLDEDGENLLDAIIIAPLDFTNYFTDLDSSWSSAIKNYAGYEKFVLEKFLDAEGVIPTIGAGDEAIKYTIDGNVKGEAAVITALKIKGNGVFGYKGGASVSNVTLKGVNVDAGAAKTATFVTDDNGSHITFKNVTVDGGTLTTTAENASKAVLRYAYNNNLDAEPKPVDVKAYPKDPDAEINFAIDLYVQATAKFDAKYTTETGIRFSKVQPYGHGKAPMVCVDDATVAKKFIDAIDYTSSYAKTANNWFSVVSGYDAEAKTATMSYWTGLVANEVNADAVYTAEELAYAVKERNETNVLTNNIDLMNKDWSVNMGDWTTDASISVTSNQPKLPTVTYYEISHVNLEPAEDSTAPYLSLFGYQAGVSNIKVTDITINATKDSFVSGLAIDGSVLDVTVGSVTVKNAAAVKEGSAIGGMLMRAPSVEEVTVNAFAAEGAEVKAGFVLGELQLGDAPTYKFTGIHVGEEDNHPFGVITVKKPTIGDQSYSSLEFDDYDGYTGYTKDDFVGDQKDGHYVELTINKAAKPSLIKIFAPAK